MVALTRKSSAFPQWILITVERTTLLSEKLSQRFEARIYPCAKHPARASKGKCSNCAQEGFKVAAPNVANFGLSANQRGRGRYIVRASAHVIAITVHPCERKIKRFSDTSGSALTHWQRASSMHDRRHPSDIDVNVEHSYLGNRLITSSRAPGYAPLSLAR